MFLVRYKLRPLYMLVERIDFNLCFSWVTEVTDATQFRTKKEACMRFDESGCGSRDEYETIPSDEAF